MERSINLQSHELFNRSLKQLLCACVCGFVYLCSVIDFEQSHLHYEIAQYTLFYYSIVVFFIAIQLFSERLLLFCNQSQFTRQYVTFNEQSWSIDLLRYDQACTHQDHLLNFLIMPVGVHLRFASDKSKRTVFVWKHLVNDSDYRALCRIGVWRTY